jgi:stress-induced morphogen
MATRNQARDKVVQQLRERLDREFLPDHPDARIDVKRYNPASVRIRIVDPVFKDQSLTTRDDAVWKILDALPEATRSEISLLLLLAPEETKTSLMNLEFEDPTPTRL